MVQNKTKHEIVNFVSEIAGNGLDLMLNISTLFSTYSWNFHFIPNMSNTKSFKHFFLHLRYYIAK